MGKDLWGFGLTPSFPWCPQYLQYFGSIRSCHFAVLVFLGNSHSWVGLQHVGAPTFGYSVSVYICIYIYIRYPFALGKRKHNRDAERRKMIRLERAR